MVYPVSRPRARAILSPQAVSAAAGASCACDTGPESNAPTPLWVQANMAVMLAPWMAVAVFAAILAWY